jgi:hypothetical protein
MAKTRKPECRKSTPSQSGSANREPVFEPSPEVCAWLTPEARKAALDWSPSVRDLYGLAARCPERVPSINGELPWIALTLADLD